MPQSGQPRKKKGERARTTTRLPAQRVALDFVVLGDFAQSVNGKLTVVGAGWNMVNATQYPVTIPFGLGIGILVPWNETNQKHMFEFLIRSESGEEIAKGGGEFEAGRMMGIPAGITQRVVLGLAGQLKLPAAGTYEIRVIAATDEKRVVFEAMPVPRSAMQLQ